MNSNPRKQLQQNPQNYKLHYLKGRIRKYYGPERDHNISDATTHPNNAEPFNIQANGEFLGAGTNKNTGVDALRRAITAVFTYNNPHLTRFHSIFVLSY